MINSTSNIFQPLLSVERYPKNSQAVLAATSMNRLNFIDIQCNDCGHEVGVVKYSALIHKCCITTMQRLGKMVTSVLRRENISLMIQYLNSIFHDTACLPGT